MSDDPYASLPRDVRERILERRLGHQRALETEDRLRGSDIPGTLPSELEQAAMEDNADSGSRERNEGADPLPPERVVSGMPPDPSQTDPFGDIDEKDRFIAELDEKAEPNATTPNNTLPAWMDGKFIWSDKSLYGGPHFDRQRHLTPLYSYVQEVIDTHPALNEMIEKRQNMAWTASLFLRVTGDDDLRRLLKQRLEGLREYRGMAVGANIAPDIYMQDVFAMRNAVQDSLAERAYAWHRYATAVADLRASPGFDSQAERPDWLDGIATRYQKAAQTAGFHLLVAREVRQWDVDDGIKNRDGAKISAMEFESMDIAFSVRRRLQSLARFHERNLAQKKASRADMLGLFQEHQDLEAAL